MELNINTALITILILVVIFLSYNLYLNRQESIIGNNDENFDKYGNINLDKDVDTLQQRNYIPIEKNNSTINNNGVIDRAIYGYITEHTPNEPGISNSSSATMTNFYLGQPAETEFIRESYDVRAIDADEALSRKQQHRSDMNRKAIEGKVRSTKNLYNKYFADELDQNEKRDWWSSEADDYETSFDLS